MRCKYCGGEASGYEPELRRVVDYVPYGDREVPIVSYEGSEASYLCDDCGRELGDDEVFEGAEPDDLEEYLGIDPVEGRKLDLYMDIVNRLRSGTFEAIGYIGKSVESWRRREKESGRWDKE